MIAGVAGVAGAGAGAGAGEEEEEEEGLYIDPLGVS
jgi:hypothetical protein